MATEIYYFSGTGNSLAVARELASKLGAALSPLAPLAEKETVVTDAEAIGIVFPVYFGELPVIVKKFASKLEGAAGKYIFAVCTFGGAAGCSLKILRDVLRPNGGGLAAGFGVHMPQNSFRKPWEKPGKIYRSCGKRLDMIAKVAVARRRGVFLPNIPAELAFGLLYSIMRPAFKEGIREYSHASQNLSQDDLIALTDTSFSINRKCNGCGLCAKVCPVNNIRLNEGKPEWQHRCEACLACYNWCPNGAIAGGVAAKGFHYKHPQVKATDFMHT